MTADHVDDNYKNAPISEFICGVIFQNGILSSIIHELITQLKPDYKVYQVLPTIFEEEVDGFRVFQNMNYDAAGFTLYRLFSPEKRTMVQLQNNLILVNWVREDIEKVGGYPGFHSVYSVFKGIFDSVEQMINRSNPQLDFYTCIKSFTLHYQDRVVWKEHIDSLEFIDKILNLKVPALPGKKVNSANNIASKYTVPVEEIGGYAIVTISTGTAPAANRQLLIVECRIKGKLDSDDIDNWFDNAHELQLNFFNSIFNQEILQTWKK